MFSAFINEMWLSGLAGYRHAAKEYWQINDTPLPHLQATGERMHMHKTHNILFHTLSSTNRLPDPVRLYRDN
jgi:hypothetical protein